MRDDLDFQAIEFWADGKAAEAVMGGFVLHSPDAVPTMDKRQRLFLWSFAIYTLFRIWGLKIDLMELKGGTHPPTALRFTTAIVGAGRPLIEKVPEIAQDYLSIVQAGRLEAERAIVYCGGPALRRDDVIGTESQAAQAYLDLVASHHDDVLSAEMSQHAFVKLTPAASAIM